MSGRGPHVAPVPAEAAARVRDLLIGSLSRADREQSLAHLRACPACAGLYSRCAEVEREAFGSGDGMLGPAGIERVMGWLDIADAQKRAPAPQTSASWFARLARLRIALPVVAAAIAVAGIVAVLPRDPGTEWAARGHSPAQPNLEVGLRLFRLEHDRDRGPIATALPDGIDVVLAPGEEIGLSYTNVGAHEHAAWIAVGPSGRTVVLGELPSRIRSGVVDEPLDVTIPLDDRFSSGTWRLYALFAPAPVDAARAADRVRGSAGLPEAFPEHPAAAQRARTLQIGTVR